MDEDCLLHNNSITLPVGLLTVAKHVQASLHRRQVDTACTHSILLTVYSYYVGTLIALTLDYISLLARAVGTLYVMATV